MQLTIRLLSGAVKHLEVSDSNTVGELKNLISQLFGEPPHKQKLSADTADNGAQISLEDDSRTLDSYGLHTGSVVSLLITNPGPFQVFVRNEKNQTRMYEVDVNETVNQLQTKILHTEGVPVDQQKLIFNDRQLEPGKSLQEYNIASRSTILMRLCVQRQISDPAEFLSFPDRLSQPMEYTYPQRPSRRVQISRRRPVRDCVGFLARRSQAPCTLRARRHR